MESLGRAVFISDCHLGSGPPDADRARHSRLQHFLETEGSRSDTLFLLGDLFDFWIEYRHAIPNQHFEILRGLRTLRERGLRIVYVGGNHDYWAGPFLSEVIGCEVRREPFEETVQGRRLFLAHGDGLRASERGYRFMRSILRAGWFGVLYRSMHPDWGIPLARALSRTSRDTNDESRVSIPDLCREIAEPRFAGGIDAVVIGHYHHPTHLRQNGKEFLILGDWIRNDSFAVLEDGRFQLCRWVEGESRPIDPRDWNEEPGESPETERSVRVRS